MWQLIVCLTLFCASHVYAQSNAAPDSLCNARSYGGHDYWFCLNDRPQRYARSRCQLVGMDLAVIETRDENEFIRRALGIEHAYIGGSDAAREGDWRWLGRDLQFWSGGALGSAPAGVFTNWALGHPAIALGTFQDCATIWPLDGLWRAEDCNLPDAYVCERFETTSIGQTGPKDGPGVPPNMGNPPKGDADVPELPMDPKRDDPPLRTPEEVIAEHGPRAQPAPSALPGSVGMGPQLPAAPVAPTAFYARARFRISPDGVSIIWGRRLDQGALVTTGVIEGPILVVAKLSDTPAFVVTTKDPRITTGHRPGDGSEIHFARADQGDATVSLPESIVASPAVLAGASFDIYEMSSNVSAFEAVNLDNLTALTAGASLLGTVQGGALVRFVYPLIAD